ncbi:MAG: family 16 glycoside hydrolase, partial [Verrucomicrobiota bacterium]
GSEKATFILNNQVVLETFDFIRLNKKNGTDAPLDKGHIALQAEGSEVLFRNILIQEIPGS